MRLRACGVALELQRAAPVHVGRLGGIRLARALGPGHGLRGRCGRARVVAADKCVSGAKASGAGTAGVVVERIGQGLERLHVGQRLGAPAGVAQHRAALQQQCEAGLGIGLGGQREGAAQAVERGHVGIAAGCVFTGLAEIQRRVGVVAAALEVLCDQTEVFARALAAARRQPIGRAAVLLALVALEHAVVSHLMQQVVLEDVLVHALERAGLAAVHQLAALQRFQRRRRGLGRIAGDALQGLVPEHMADHAGMLQRRALGQRQAVQPRLQHPGQRGRHMHGDELVGLHMPRLGGRQDHAVVDQHAQQFLGEVRVAFGAAGEQVAQRGWHRGKPAEQRVGQVAAAAA